MQQPQIVHETEVHRQHVRLKIPVQVEIDGVRYQVDDWSVGGFGIESVLTSRQPGERFPVRMIFPFEEFDMSMRFEARMVYVDQDHGRFGCAFTGLSRDQVAVFRYLVDAYLSGEVVSAGDILQIRARDAAARPRTPPEFTTLPAEEDWVARARRWGLYAAFGLAGFALALLIGLGLKDRFFTVAARSAVVEAPVVELRAPIAGRFVATLDPAEPVGPGTLLGTMRGPDGAIAAIDSPCDCIVLEQLAPSGQHYPVGTALVALVEADQPLVVRAQLPLEEVEGLQVGDRAEIRIPGRADLLYGQITRINLRPRLETLRQAEFDLPMSQRLAQVVIRPDRPLGLEDFGALASVRFL